MNRNEMIKMLDRESRRMHVPLKEFGMNRRILTMNAPVEWDIVPSGTKLRVTRRSLIPGANLGEPVLMDPEYILAVMRAIATGEAEFGK